LKVEKAVVGVERIGKHAAKFKAADLLLEAADIAFDADQGFFVILAAGKLEQFGGIGQLLVDIDQRQYDAFQQFLLLAQFLGALGVVPDLGIFEIAVQFFELRGLGIEVKDTSAVRRYAGGNR
jgi:hypothetical protein